MELVRSLMDNGWTRDAGILGIAILGAAVLYWLAIRVAVTLAHRIARSTRGTWDDALVEQGVFRRIALLAPAVVMEYALNQLTRFGEAASIAVSLYLLVVGLLIFDAVLNSLRVIYEKHPMASRRPIRGVVQLIKLFAVLLGLVAGVALVLGKSPWGLLSGIGAMTAVLLLVFKDTLLSFVAGIQMAANDLLRVGDWLEMPAFGADGDVADISLNTVRVRNFDKTIVSIPTHKFLDSSFKNWRGMEEAGGRRIKRSLILDQTSARFVDDALMERFLSMDLIRDYVRTRQEEIERANREAGADPSLPVNGRRMTNLGCFRAYAANYLISRPDIRKDMTLMVRQLAPTNQGLPLEIYAFTSDTAWPVYESIQADIFDHLLAALPWFDLRVYQRNALADRRPETMAGQGPA